MTTSNIYAFADTWNNSGTTFNGIWLDVTNGASGAPVYAAGSLLGRLTVNGANAWAMSPTGALTLGTAGSIAGSMIMSGLTSGTLTLRVNAAAGTGTIFEFPASNGSSGNLLKTDGAGVTSWLGTTGSGNAVLATSPTLVTPTLGAATATSVNKLAITAPATGATLAIADGKTLTVSNTVTLAGTNGSTLDIGGGGTLASAAFKSTGTSGNTVPLLDGTNTWSAAQTILGSLNCYGMTASGNILPSSGYTYDLGANGQCWRAVYIDQYAYLGYNGTYSGAAKLYGSTSGDCTITVAATAGTATKFQLPTNNGTNLYVLQTDGTGITSWVPQTGGGGGGGNVSNVGTPTNGQLAQWTSSTTIQGLAVTGTGNAVLATSPTLTTPNLGTPSAATLTNATGLPVGTGISGLGTGIATWLGTPSSANLAAALTDKTGTGVNVFAVSPSLTTPSLGDATATTVNKVAFTAPATGATLTLIDGTTITGPSSTATLAGLGLAQSFTATQTFNAATNSIILGANSGNLGVAKFFGSTSGDVTVKAAAAAGTATVFQLPATNGTSGYVLQTNGSGVTSWVAQTGGGGGTAVEPSAIFLMMGA